MDNCEKVFFNNIPAYLSIINTSLSTQFESTPLKKYVKLLGGYAFKSAEYQKTGIPIIRISDFQNEKIVLKKAIYYNESEEFEKYELDSGDIIIALTGGTIGKLAIVQSGLGKLYLNQRVAKFQVLDTSKIANEYVYWVARGVQDNVKKLALGGAQPNVSSKQVEEMNFPIPDIEIQFDIIAFINDLKNKKLKTKIYFSQSVEEKILKLQEITLKIFDFSSEQEKQSGIISKLKQAILQEAITGQLTTEWRTQTPMQKGNPDTDAAALLAKIKTEKQQLITDGKLKKEKPLAKIAIKEIPFSIPDNWVWCRLGEICDFITKGTTPSSTEFKDGGEIPYLKVYNIVNQKINFHYRSQFIERSVHERLSRSKVYPKDVIMNIVGPPLGKIAIVPDDFKEWNINQALAIFRCIENSVNQYIYLFLNEGTEIKKIQTLGVVGQDNISLAQCRDIFIPLAPLAEQKAIVEKVDKLMNIIDQLEQQIKHRKQLAENLMQTVLR
ncbi:MAG: hypothetical protein AUK48_08165 [Oscillatoriales cyanobacterium CG2_30_44_21]|nr:MAG: hypothetical protein AUK48_08165 [Oscillatoriales cyanobacterium CG2_30_44_21]